jgi:hypothetical protein
MVGNIFKTRGEPCTLINWAEKGIFIVCKYSPSSASIVIADKPISLNDILSIFVYIVLSDILCYIISKLLKLVNLWNETLYANPKLFTDHYSDEQGSYFNDIRHDQSVFSVIKKMHNTITLPEKTWFVPFGNKESLEYPFWATRFR